MEYVLGALVVVTVLAFVVLPLLRSRGADTAPRAADDTAPERAEIYRELLELELDQRVGKITAADYQELSDVLLARAAALISLEDAEATSADAALEREIAAARKTLGRLETTPATSASPGSMPAEETPA